MSGKDRAAFDRAKALRMGLSINETASWRYDAENRVIWIIKIQAKIALN